MGLKSVKKLVGYGTGFTQASKALGKLTGADAQLEAARANADAQEASTKQAAAAQQRALMDAARAAADSQIQITARAAAEDAASEAVAQPLATADVQLGSSEENSPSKRRTRRASFGRNYSSGVNL
jgi:hypothetical protein